MQKLDAVDAPSLRDIRRSARATAPGCTSKVVGASHSVSGLQGVVIARRGHGVSSTFTIRRFLRRGRWPYLPGSPRSTTSRPSSPKGDVRRAKLYYLRERHGKARIKEHTPARPSEASRATCLGIFHGKARHRALVSGLLHTLGWSTRNKRRMRQSRLQA